MREGGGTNQNCGAPARRAIGRLGDLNDGHPRVGPWLCISSAQYFIVQFLVALRWSPPYSLSKDTISDLGNTACGKFNDRFVCSPLHAAMNVSFVTLGVTMVLGCALLHHAFSSTGSRLRTLGFSLVGVGGIGVIVVGVFPENSVPAFHGIGAALPFVLGNIGVVLLGFSLSVPLAMRILTLFLGAVALLSLMFYASTHYLGLGEGGVERLVAYPQTVWLILIGAFVLSKRWSHERR